MKHIIGNDSAAQTRRPILNMGLMLADGLENLASFERSWIIKSNNKPRGSPAAHRSTAQGVDSRDRGQSDS